MNDALASLAWPLAKLGEALSAVARRSGLPARQVQMPAPPSDASADEQAVRGWLQGATEWLGLEAEPLQARYGDVADLIRAAGPVLIPCSDGKGRDGYWVVLSGGRRTVRLLDPEWRIRRVEVEALRAAVCAFWEDQLADRIERVLDTARIAPQRRARARQVLLQDRLAAAPIRGFWLVRLPPSGRFIDLLRDARVGCQAATVIAANAAEFLLLLAGWWLVGRGALQGQLEAGWLVAWALVLLTAVPIRALSTQAGGRLAVDAGAVVKQRLLAGALELEPEEVKSQGAGQHFGRVLESEAVETLALSGGLAAVMAAIQLVFVIPVLAVGAGGWWHALWFVAWVAVTLALAYREYRTRDRWTSERLDMTHDLVERMVGHRTRLAQQRAGRWHGTEDQILERYLRVSRVADGATVLTTALGPRGWLFVGVLGLAPAFVAGSTPPALLAVSIGGVLAGSMALGQLTLGVSQAMAAVIAFRQIRQLFFAARRRQPPKIPLFALAAEQQNTTAAIEANDVVFRYPARTAAVLAGCSVRASTGERLLLEGPSGGGKSTLGAVLGGLRQPEAGMVLLGGLDVGTVGKQRWRRQVACVPQFHDNHVLTGTVAFNLLMGRGWPPNAEDLEQAEAIAGELGLGPLLERMPSGMQQMVGETGWRLSHGERSRLFMARALLQGADVLILDESFAALDPQTLQAAMNCVLKHAPTLIVIAHP